MNGQQAEHRIASLERQLRHQRRALGAAVVVGTIALLGAFAPGSRDVIRTRGIVIVDERGRQQILIGAPIPAAANRVRTNPARVERAWASRFPDPQQYMRWYAGYRHSMHGILVLDENGYDRLAIGDSTPDPNSGKRVGAGRGIEINDARGFERTGYGILTVAGKDRVVLGLDGSDGEEAVVLSVHDGGTSGLSVRAKQGRSIFLGASPASTGRAATNATSGLLLLRGDTTVHRLSTEDAPKPE